MNRLTLSEQFFRDQASASASGGLSTVLNRFSLLARMLASEIMRAGFVGKLGYTGTTNVQDENVRALDVIANDTMLQVFENMPMVAAVASEEMEELHVLPGGESGKYLITVDRSAKELDIVVAANGVGLPAGFAVEQAAGLGLQIVRTLVEAELLGSIEMGARNGDPGTYVHLSFALSGGGN